MRVVLVVFSTFIAGYFVWKSWNVSAEAGKEDDDSKSISSIASTATSPSWTQKIYKWLAMVCVTLFDMASGRYLYLKWSESNTKPRQASHAQRQPLRAKAH